MQNRRFLLVARPTGPVTPDLFKFVSEPVPTLQPGEVLVKNRYLSVDPTNRIWMSDMPQYMPPIALGEVVRAGGVGRVEASTVAKFKPGDMVSGLLGWQDYSVHGAEALNKLPPLDAPATAFLSVLGLTGCTAYFGLLNITAPKAGETLVVSGAAGAVGSIVGQIGLIAGLRVIGIAGGEEKARWLTEELGFHGAIDYKKGDVDAQLKRLAPEGVDIYFDNVGGDISDAVVLQMNLHGRISLCGLICGYNEAGPMAMPKQYAQILMKRLSVKGFIVTDFLSEWPKAVKALHTWVQSGRIKYQEDIEHGLEQAPRVLNKLFDGSNKGKQILQLD